MGQRENARKNKHLWGIPRRKLGEKMVSRVEKGTGSFVVKEANWVENFKKDTVVKITLLIVVIIKYLSFTKKQILF